MKLFSTKEAAEYLGLAAQTVRWHINVKEDLEPDTRIGGRFLVFSQETLDAFREGREPEYDNGLEIFGTHEAAEYLGVTVDTIWYHVNREGNLTPDRKIAGRLVFTKETLDEFEETRRSPGRPPKKLDESIG